MVYAGRLIFTAGFAALIIVIIRKCFVKLRNNNSQHVKHDKKARIKDTEGEPIYNIDSDCSDETTDGEPSYTDGQAQEWNLRDAINRQRLEDQVEQISHLCYDSSSEEEPQENIIKLKSISNSRLSRLEVSSSSTDCDQSQARVEAATPCKPHRRRRVRKHKELWGNTAVALCKPPGSIHLQGPLSRTNDYIIYNKINKELIYQLNKNPSQNIQVYLDKKFELSRKDDMAVMSLIQGIHAAWYMPGETQNGDTQQVLPRCKQLLRDIHTYHLQYPAIAEAQVNWYMCAYYMLEGKSGKAYSALQAAVSCNQNHTPSTWTARVCALEGAMYDKIAQATPGHRRKYQDLALRCFTNAREQCLYQHYVGQEDYFFYPLYYALHKVHIKLDMPTLYTISLFSGTDIVFQRLKECVVPQCQVNEAQDLLVAVTSHLTSLTPDGRAGIKERISICKIIVNIRLTQLAIRDKAHRDKALSFLTTAEHLYDEYCRDTSQYPNSRFRFEMYPHLADDIRKNLENLYDHLTPITTPDPYCKPEQLSDSLSSEPHEGEPSGLKQLTKESRREEKQVHLLSSGDVYSNSGADVPSDAL